LNISIDTGGTDTCPQIA